MSNRISLGIIAVFIAALAAGCGGTTSPDGDDGDTSGGSTGGNGATGSGNTDQVQIGSFDPSGQFVPNEIANTKDTLEAGQQSSLTVALVAADGNAPPDETSIAFTSACTTNSLATLDPQTLQTFGGRAATTYTSAGCSRWDDAQSNDVDKKYSGAGKLAYFRWQFYRSSGHPGDRWLASRAGSSQLQGNQHSWWAGG